MLPNNKANTAPDLAPETLEILREADLKFRKLLRNEPIFPDRLGVILAAGAATRFRPLTASKHLAERGELDNNEHYGVVAWNKASLPIANCPLLD
ncbi:MAG: hypothetical protein GY854_05620, partial [Deltaproteobacteria bacterium]|nr:hypothetical protein [Deltaproteobacteria bacterium]